MKIVYVTPGSGGSFYCQNCFQDYDLLVSLNDLGHDVIQMPMYLPVNPEKKTPLVETPVFYGAINIYLKEKIPFVRHAPAWIERLLDSSFFLNLAAKKAGSTRAAGLEEMTLSMLRGEEGRQDAALGQMISYLQQEIKPDIVHFSNALLLGSAHRIKRDLGAVVFCSLQDENEWVDLMLPHYQKKVWALIAEKAGDVDCFVTASRYYAEKSSRRLNIPTEKIKVIGGGLDLKEYEKSPLNLDPPVLGYMYRMSEYFGLSIVVDAFLLLKQDHRFENLRLHLTGGYSRDDKAYVSGLLKKAAIKGFGDAIEIFPEFKKPDRIEFLKTLTILSVPVPTGEALGVYQIEALAAGVPVVQPNIGGYPEFIQATQGGVIYAPNNSEALAGAVAGLLTHPEKIRILAEQGRKAVLEHYSIKNIARKIIRIYQNVTRIEQYQEKIQDPLKK